MYKGNVTVVLPNPHQSDTGRELLARVLRQAGVSHEDWERLLGPADVALVLGSGKRWTPPISPSDVKARHDARTGCGKPQIPNLKPQTPNPRHPGRAGHDRMVEFTRRVMSDERGTMSAEGDGGRLTTDGSSNRQFLTPRA